MSWTRTLDDHFGARLRHDVDLGPFTTYRVGGPARRLIEANDDDDLVRLADAIGATGVPTLVIGKGSNLLVADAGFDGVAIVVGDAFASIEVDDTIIRAGAAASLPVVARRTARAGLTGFEWAVGVPGSIGGAVRMNAGGHGSDIAATLRRARIFDLHTGDDRIVDATELDLAYRSSAITPSQIVLWAELVLTHGDRERAEAEISEIVRWRRANQPGGSNAGSVFTNPPGDSAGRLIDLAGGRGHRHGTAEVSPKHANFIQADPGGSADDVHALMIEVRDLVWRTHRVRLHPETRLVGFDPFPEPQDDR